MSEFKILCYTMRDRGTPPTWSWVDLALRMRCDTNEIYPCWPCCSDFIIISNLHCHVKEYTTPAACGRGLRHISPFLILNCIRHWTRNTPATLTLVQRRRSSRCLILLIVCTCSVGIEAAGNTCFRGRTNQIWKTKGNAIKNELFIINGIRHVISDEMPVITSSLTNKICLSDEMTGIRYLKSQYGSRVNRTNTASRSMLF